MQELILNLDYGSYLTKCIWKFYEPGRHACGVPPYGLNGSWSGGILQADPSLQLGPGESLKEAFLLNQLSPLELDSYRTRVCQDLEQFVFTGVAGRVEASGLKKFQLLINVHTPLRFQDSHWVAETGVFRITDPEHHMMGPHYRDLDDFRAAARCAKGSRELIWAVFLTDCLEKTALGLAPQSIQVAAIPESLTTVNRMVDHFEPDQRRQFLMLDIGHFTTDYALVAFDKLGTNRFIVRCANSVFEAGSRFISQAGESKWIEKIVKELKNNQTKERRPLPYMELAVVFVGGGSAALGDQVRKDLVKEVSQWACEDPHFKEGVRDRRISVFREEPVLPEFGLFPLREADGLPSEWSYEQMPTHVPCITACMHAEDFREIHFRDDAHAASSSDGVESAHSGNASEGQGHYPIRENDGWPPPPPEFRCPTCGHVSKSQRDLQLHVFQSHPSGHPVILKDGKAVFDGSRLDIRQRSELSLIRFQNWSHAILIDGNRRIPIENPRKDQPVRELMGLPDHAHVVIEAVLKGENIDEAVTRCTLEVAILDACWVRGIEEQFYDWMQGGDRRFLINRLTEAIRDRADKAEKEFVSTLQGFVLAMNMRDRAEGLGTDLEGADDKLHCVTKVLGNQESPLARILTGIAWFILAQLPEDLPSTGDPFLDGALQRLENPSSAHRLSGHEKSSLFASAFPLLDRHTRSLLNAFSLPSNEITACAEDASGSPFPSDQMKWNLLMASAMTEEGRSEEARCFLDNIPPHHPKYGGWVSACMERIIG